MIYCVWYPSGGFGHFVNSMINLYGNGFVRPRKKLSFSSDGNSHNLDYVAPPYLMNQARYYYKFNPSMNYSVIVDNGINNEDTAFMQHFPGAEIIKLCYSDRSWPVVAHTMIYKAMKSNFDQEIALNTTKWDVARPWVRREQYFLYLRDHHLRHAWKASTISHNLFVENLMSYDSTCSALNNIGIQLADFSDVYKQWFEANLPYFEPVEIADQFVNHDYDKPITDVWTQAVVYYQIWCQYGIEVPHNEFENFFESQQQYQTWLEDTKSKSY